jgi:serine/threonine protein kinase/tetratricopeptide (TPR) repeat protein
MSMKPERWEHLKELFAEALTLGGAERERFLDRACAGDGELRDELDALLTAEHHAGGFLAGSAAEVLLRELQEPASSPIGRRFGAYRVVSEIGRGGMGVVYRAVRDDDTFHKEVALKLLHTDLALDYFEERFRRERQILATLDHPNIARLLDGGADETGRPYCVLELVEGTHIDAYCREHGLDLAARLELVRTACSAVALAHSRLVVHCDLKPANVLVTADGTVKLLDFGIAKLLASEPSGPAPAVTVAGWWMTPEYASPEQVRGEPVTTATDVYAIGVMLFELLTGRKPYDLGTRSPDEMVRAICEQEVTRPSQAVVRLRPDGAVDRTKLASPAGAPDANARRLRRRLEGDLDTIVLRALAKDPSRRYASVVQLSDDLRRHLSGLPIRARPDRVGYRVRKFVGRNRVAVAAALLVLATLCGGLIATVQQARVAHAERLVAERRFDEVRSLAGTFIFEIHDEVAALPGSTAVRKRIVELGLQYLERLEQEAGDDAALQAELATAYERIAAVQGGVGVANLGDRNGAIRSQQRAVVLRETVARGAPADLGAQLALAKAHSSLGDLVGAAGDRTGRLDQYEQANRIRSAAAALAPADPAVRRAVAAGRWDEAQVRVDDGDLEGGLAAFEAVLELYRDLGEAPGATDGDRRNLALACKKVGAVRSVVVDPEGALDSLTAALAIDQQRMASNPSHPETMLDVAFDHGDLGYVLLQLGRPDDAVVHYEQAVGLRETVSAADPEDVRARSVLRSGQQRLAGALAAVVARGGLPCAEVVRHAERAAALWAAAEADSPLDEDAAAQREQLVAAADRCSSLPQSP